MPLSCFSILLLDLSTVYFFILENVVSPAFLSHSGMIGVDCVWGMNLILQRLSFILDIFDQASLFEKFSPCDLLCNAFCNANAIIYYLK
jgi:hypothetical protein